MNREINNSGMNAMVLSWDTWDEMCTHANVGYLRKGQPEGVMDGWKIAMLVPTKHGLDLAHEGDIIIRYESGELDICAPDLFYGTFCES